MGAYDGFRGGYRQMNWGNKTVKGADMNKEATYATYVRGSLDDRTDPYVDIAGVHYTLQQARELAEEILEHVGVETVTKYKLI